jgi:S1-C subfamily serine protease
MMAPATAAVLALLAAAPEHRPTDAGDPLRALERRQMEIFDAVAPSVVFISTADGFGSGFFVSRDGLIVTNAHVVGRRTKVTVVTHDGRKLVGTVVERAAHGVDLAAVDVPLTGTKPLPLAPASELAVGLWAAAVGHGRGGIWTFNTGMIANIYPADRSRPLIQTQIPLNPGASGGPVIDRQGRVLGVTTAGVTDAQSMNFALRADLIAAALRRVRPHCACLVVHAPQGAQIFVDDVLVGSGPEAVVLAQPRTYAVRVVHRGRRTRHAVRFPRQRSVDAR